MMRTIVFDAAELPGDARLRKERWVDSLSSGYVRLLADARPDKPFDGSLRIKILGLTAIGRISGTVQTIARTPTEIAAENTDNAVLLLNSGSSELLVGQDGKSIECARGAAVLIEQCEPSFIKAGPQRDCNFVAVQLPRQCLRRRYRSFEERFMTPVMAPTSALTLLRSYIDALLDCPDGGAAGVPRFAADHVADLIAAAIAPADVSPDWQSPNLREGRLEAIRREVDRSFMMPDFSLTILARRLEVSPRHIQALLAEAGTSFTDEVARRRLTLAHNMLASSCYKHMSVMDIALECGFPTVSHFHRVFRKHFDATPGEVRGTAAAPPPR
jgi:AraC-like DNA-binding protein